jgi:uncharacterized membrane protein YbhN (UPF0104 family)
VNGPAVSPLPRAGILFRVLWVIAPLAIVVVVLSRLTEFSAIAGALAGASPIWLGAAVICMMLVLTSFGVPLEVAAAAAVLFRVFTFWLPMLTGFLTWRLSGAVIDFPSRPQIG